MDSVVGCVMIPWNVLEGLTSEEAIQMLESLRQEIDSLKAEVEMLRSMLWRW